MWIYKYFAAAQCAYCIWVTFDLWLNKPPQITTQPRYAVHTILQLLGCRGQQQRTCNPAFTLWLAPQRSHEVASAKINIWCLLQAHSTSLLSFVGAFAAGLEDLAGSEKQKKTHASGERLQASVAPLWSNTSFLPGNRQIPKIARLGDATEFPVWIVQTNLLQLHWQTMWK